MCLENDRLIPTFEEKNVLMKLMMNIMTLKNTSCHAF
jgi:hypothetical protein